MITTNTAAHSNNDFCSHFEFDVNLHCSISVIGHQITADFTNAMKYKWIYENINKIVLFLTRIPQDVVDLYGIQMMGHALNLLITQ